MVEMWKFGRKMDLSALENNIHFHFINLIPHSITHLPFVKANLLLRFHFHFLPRPRPPLWTAILMALQCLCFSTTRTLQQSIVKVFFFMFSMFVCQNISCNKHARTHTQPSRSNIDCRRSAFGGKLMKSWWLIETFQVGIFFVSCRCFSSTKLLIMSVCSCFVFFTQHTEVSRTLKPGGRKTQGFPSVIRRSQFKESFLQLKYFWIIDRNWDQRVNDISPTYPKFFGCSTNIFSLYISRN